MSGPRRGVEQYARDERTVVFHEQSLSLSLSLSPYPRGSVLRSFDLTGLYVMANAANVYRDSRYRVRIASEITRAFTSRSTPRDLIKHARRCALCAPFKSRPSFPFSTPRAT